MSQQATSQLVNLRKAWNNTPRIYRLSFLIEVLAVSAPHYRALRGEPMDLKALIDCLGEGFPTSDLYNVLKCPQCKGRKFLFMLTPVHFSYGDAQHENVTPQSHYATAMH